ncbi:MAG TPA: AMP-binding protein, partial [Solirubrobacteraceae bacterium]
MTEALRRTAAAHPEIVALRTPDDNVSLTRAELLARVEAVAGGLAKLGVGRGDTVAIMLSNRPEFNIVDLATAMLGAAPFSIYTTYPAEEIRHLCADASARVAIVERAFVDSILEVQGQVPQLEHVIVVDGDPPAGC